MRGSCEGGPPGPSNGGQAAARRRPASMRLALSLLFMLLPSFPRGICCVSSSLTVAPVSACLIGSSPLLSSPDVPFHFLESHRGLRSWVWGKRNEFRGRRNLVPCLCHPELAGMGFALSTVRVILHFRLSPQDFLRASLCGFLESCP